MSGIGGSEFLLLCLIGLLVLGPERLPRVAAQLGRWLGQAQRMTRNMRRQLQEELDVERNIGFDPKELDPTELLTARDDTDSPQQHEKENNDGGAKRE